MRTRKKLFSIILVLLIIFIPIITLKFCCHEQGTFYELKMSKYYKNKTFNTILVCRSNNCNLQAIDDKNSKKSLKIFNYLNEFNFTECRKNKMLSNSHIKKYKSIEMLHFLSSDYDMLHIILYDKKHIQIDIHKEPSTTKYYEINNGSISFKKLEDLLK